MTVYGSIIKRREKKILKKCFNLLFKKFFLIYYNAFTTNHVYILTSIFYNVKYIYIYVKSVTDTSYC